MTSISKTKNSGYFSRVTSDYNATINGNHWHCLKVNAKKMFLPDIATSLFEITQKSFDKMDLLKHLMVQQEQDISQFEQLGFQNFLSDWQDYDLLYQQKIVVIQGNQSLQGIAQGVNQKGHLQIQDLKGKCMRLEVEKHRFSLLAIKKKTES